MPANTHSIPSDHGDPWVFNLERPKLRSLGLIALEVSAAVLICVLASEAFAVDVSPRKLCLCQALSCITWLTLRKYGGGIPWMRMGVLHYLPACLLLALVHQAANCPMLTSPNGLLLVDGVAFLSATLVLYKDALGKWEQIPHPTWEGFPIFWRAGPEHAAAAFSEWLKHLRWELEWQLGKAMDTTDNRYCTDLHVPEGSAAAAPADDFGSLCTSPANPRLDSISEEPLDSAHHLHPAAEPSLTNSTPPTAPPHTPKDARLPEGSYGHASGNTKDEILPSIAVTTAEQATTTVEEATTTAEEATSTAEEDADAPEPPPSLPAAPSLENEEVGAAVDVQDTMPAAIHNMRMSRTQAPSTPLTPPEAAVVQESATAASFAGNDSFSAWMNCSKDADLDIMLFRGFGVPIMAQAGALPVSIEFSSFPILTPADNETAAAASGAAATGDEVAAADGLATLDSVGPSSDDDGNAAAAENVHGSSAHLHFQTTPTCQGSMSEGPTTPPATPRMTPMASLRRSASSLKEKMIGVKASFRSKRGADVTPTQDRGVFRPHTGCFNGVHSSSSSRKRVKAAAATIKRRLTPNRTNRGVWKV